MWSKTNNISELADILVDKNKLINGFRKKDFKFRLTIYKHPKIKYIQRKIFTLSMSMFWLDYMIKCHTRKSIIYR